MTVEGPLPPTRIISAIAAGPGSAAPATATASPSSSSIRHWSCSAGPSAAQADDLGAKDWGAVQEAARKEGRVSLYHNLRPQGAEVLLGEFRKANPGVQTEHIRLGSAPLIERFATEFNAGRNLADVMVTFPDDAYFAGIDKGGWALEWTPPELAKFKPEANYHNRAFAVHTGRNVIIWNKQRVKPADAPREWSDLWDPKRGLKMGISVRELVKSYGTAAVIHAISFDVADGEFVTLPGPSGCGKTTTLRCIAGLDAPNGGSITVNGRLVSDAEPGLFVPPHERDLGMVFQSYAIWPHLTVAQNVAFPLTVRGERKTGPAVAWALDVVGMGTFADHRPSELSGGQQQRVALARASAGRPQLLLFDEPLSNLDARLRDRTRTEISRIQRELKVPALYVTHDQTEALSMSDRVIVMESGRIVQEGRPEELYNRPVNRFVADFIGNANFLPVRHEGGTWRLADGTPVALDAGQGGGREPVALLRPEAIRLDAGPPGAPEDGMNRLTGTVLGSAYLGPCVEYVIGVGGSRIRAFSREALLPGSTAALTFAAADCRLVDTESWDAERSVALAG